MGCPSIFIVSQGGCGSTVFFDQLGYGSKCQHITDCECVKKHVKASYLIKMKFPKNTKILYIYGNPYDQIISLSRRNLIPHIIYEYENECYEKYENAFKNSSFLKWWANELKKFDDEEFTTNYISKYISKYIEDSNIFLDFKEHYMSWKKIPIKNVSVRLIKYDEILKSGKEKVCSWLKRDFNFHPKKRNSNYLDFKDKYPDLFKKIESRHKNWFNIYEKLPLVEDISW
jgi:hypothetical protein